MLDLITNEFDAKPGKFSHPSAWWFSSSLRHTMISNQEFIIRNARDNDARNVFGNKI